MSSNSAVATGTLNASRVVLGSLSNGGYGLQINGATGTCVINTAATITGHVAQPSPTSNWNFSVKNNQPIFTISGDNPILRTDRGDIELNKLLEMVKRAEQILCLIEADMKRLEKYPALEKAYTQYRVVNALCQDDDED